MEITNDLHNNHNVYILGAGFSRLRGLPLISDFMMQMRDALEYHAQNNHRQECDAIRAVLGFRMKASSAAYRVQVDLENIEELFSLASASANTHEESIRLAIAATLDYSFHAKKPLSASYYASEEAFAEILSWERPQQRDGYRQSSQRVPAYEYIVRALIGDRTGTEGIENTFITFNYDTIVEDALKAIGAQFSLGFEGAASSKSSASIQVLKLHGSTNWAIPKGKRSEVQVFDNYRHVVTEGLIPYLVPPTWKKDSRGALNHIWSHSLKALENATRVVIIGFSIPPTDLHFKYLLAAGLQNNYSLREIVFVNPEPGLQMVKDRCTQLFANQEHNAAKLRFINSTVEAFVGQGTMQEKVWAVARPIPESVQNLSFEGS